MAKNDTAFYLSGLLSFSLFFLILMLFVQMLFTPSKSKTFALKKDNFISISLEIPKVVKQAAKKQEEAPVIEEAVEVPEQNVDVNNLFSDVWTKKIDHKTEPKKQVNSKRLSEISKKISKKEANRVEKLSEKVNDLDTIKSKDKAEASSSAEEVNEYLAKIQAIVYQYFHVPPNTQGNSVKTVIELSSLGKVLDYRVLNYSQSSELNAEADKIKQRLKYVIFPLNPQNRSSRTIVILISKE